MFDVADDSLVLVLMLYLDFDVYVSLWGFLVVVVDAAVGAVGDSVGVGFDIGVSGDWLWWQWQCVISICWW